MNATYTKNHTKTELHPNIDLNSRIITNYAGNNWHEILLGKTQNDEEITIDLLKHPNTAIDTYDYKEIIKTFEIYIHHTFTHQNKWDLHIINYTLPRFDQLKHHYTNPTYADTQPDAIQTLENLNNIVNTRAQQKTTFTPTNTTKAQMLIITDLYELLNTGKTTQVANQHLTNIFHLGPKNGVYTVMLTLNPRKTELIQTYTAASDNLITSKNHSSLKQKHQKPITPYATYKILHDTFQSITPTARVGACY